MPTKERTDHGPPEVAADLDAGREVLRPQAAHPIHLPQHGASCQVVEHGENSSLVAAGALHDDKRICRDCARAEGSAVERRAQR